MSGKRTTIERFAMLSMPARDRVMRMRAVFIAAHRTDKFDEEEIWIEDMERLIGYTPKSAEAKLAWSLFMLWLSKTDGPVVVEVTQ